MRSYLIFSAFLCIFHIANPVRGNSEDFTEFDAKCIQDNMRICAQFLDPALTSRTNAKIIGSDFDGSIYPRAECIRMKCDGSKEKFCKNTFPLGCGISMMSGVRNLVDCEAAAKMNPKCIRNISLLTATDVKLVRESLTSQLDAWLKMLEQAGAVDLTHASDTQNPTTEPAPAPEN